MKASGTLFIPLSFPYFNCFNVHNIDVLYKNVLLSYRTVLDLCWTVVKTSSLKFAYRKRHNCFHVKRRAGSDQTTDRQVLSLSVGLVDCEIGVKRAKNASMDRKKMAYPIGGERESRETFGDSTLVSIARYTS